MTEQAQPKIQDLKNQAYTLAQRLGLHCTQTIHFKKRGLKTGLDLRTKRGWMQLIQRLRQLTYEVVVPLLKTQPQPIAA